MGNIAFTGRLLTAMMLVSINLPPLLAQQRFLWDRAREIAALGCARSQELNSLGEPVFYFRVGGEKADRLEIWVGQSDTQPGLLTTWEHDPQLAFSRAIVNASGTLALVGMNRGGVTGSSELYLLSLTGGAPRLVAKFKEQVEPLAFAARDGQAFVQLLEKLSADEIKRAGARVAESGFKYQLALLELKSGKAVQQAERAYGLLEWAIWQEEPGRLWVLNRDAGFGVVQVLPKAELMVKYLIMTKRVGAFGRSKVSTPVFLADPAVVHAFSNVGITSMAYRIETATMTCRATRIMGLPLRDPELLAVDRQAGTCVVSGATGERFAVDFGREQFRKSDQEDTAPGASDNHEPGS